MNKDYNILQTKTIKQLKKDFICTFIKKFNSSQEEKDYLIKKNKKEQYYSFEKKHLKNKKNIGNIEESIMILYNNETKKIEETKLDFNEFKNLNIFFNYKKIHLIQYNSGKKVLVLERKEYSLIDYTLKTIKNNLNIHFFYDILYFSNENFYHLISTKDNEILSEKEFESLAKDNTRTKKIIDFNNDLFIYKEKPTWYVFEYGNHYFINDKNEIKNIKNVNKYNLKLDEHQYFKIYNYNYITEILLPKNFYSHYNFHLFIYKYMNYEKLYKYNSLFKNFIIDSLKLPNSYKKIKNMNTLLKTFRFPATENTWNHFSLLSDVSYINYKNVFNINISNKEYNRELLFSKDLKGITYKEIQKNSILYKKKTNELLKEKIIITDRENVRKNEYFYYTIFYIFENNDNLNNLISLMSRSYYSFNSFDFECNVKIPYKYITENNFYDFNVLNIRDKIFNDKKNAIIIEEEIKKEFNELIKTNKIDDYYHMHTLNSENIKNLLLHFFKTNKQLEQSIVSFFKNYLSKMNMNAVVEHFYDVIQILYLIDYKYKNDFYNKKQKNIIEKFYKKNHSNLLNFEKEIYNLDTVLQSNKLQKKIPILNLNYLKTDEYYFMQPSDGFELKHIADEMKHCVFTYFDDLRKPKSSNKYVIVLYDKNNYPLVCLELKNIKNNLVCTQAKCKYNEPVYKYKKIENLILKFIKENNILNQSNDFRKT